jgi:hypothetical protein
VQPAKSPLERRNRRPIGNTDSVFWIAPHPTTPGVAIVTRSCGDDSREIDARMAKSPS